MTEFNLQAGIPTLDIKRYIEDNSEEKKAFADELGAAFRIIGFAAISGHGVPSELIEGIYEEIEKFFSLPEETKLKYSAPETNGQRGFVRFGQEHAKGNNYVDLKEFWQVGQTQLPAHADMSQFHSNICVDEQPEFSTTAEKMYKSLESVALTVLEAIAMHLELPLDYFKKYVTSGNSILRAIHYPPIVGEPNSSVRAAEHEDINLITLLVGASADGLEVKGLDGEWNKVKAQPDQLVINCGDMLQRLTNHQLKSTTHRVVNPPSELWNTTRYSIPFFCHPQPHMRLDAIEQCIPAGEEPLDRPISAGEYLNERNRTFEVLIE